MDLSELGDLKPNSNAYKKAQTEGELVAQPEKKFEAVAVGKSQKPSLGRRFKKIFFNENSKDVKSYLVFDILIPAIKDTIVNIITGGANMLFYGEASYRGPSNGIGVNYHKVNSAAMGKNRVKEQRATTYSYRGNDDFDFDDVVLESRGDCERILRDMEMAIRQYGQVTVADLYDMVQITNSNFTNYKFGWTDLTGAKYSRLRSGGYVLELPRVVDLK